MRRGGGGRTGWSLIPGRRRRWHGSSPSGWPGTRARIARALNDAAVPCPSAADPQRNPHRSGTGWTLHTVRAILGNPRYTGRQVWNRQRTDRDLVDPANTGLGHRPVQRWNLPEGWVISARPAHPALVTEADFIAVQDLGARRGPGSPAGRRYLLAGLLRCGTCGRLLESCWSNGKPAYRCRHGRTTATRPDPARPPNAYIREDQILARLPALGILLGAPGPSSRKQGRAHSRVPAGAAELISYPRARGITLTYDPGEHALRAGTHGAVSVTIDRRTSTGRRYSTG
jgi:site-specific DNA recombinase